MNGALRINQDASIYVSEVDKGEQLMVEMVKYKCYIPSMRVRRSLKVIHASTLSHETQ